MKTEMKLDSAGVIDRVSDIIRALALVRMRADGIDRARADAIAKAEARADLVRALARAEDCAGTLDGYRANLVRDLASAEELAKGLFEDLTKPNR